MGNNSTAARKFLEGWLRGAILHNWLLKGWEASIPTGKLSSVAGLGSGTGQDSAVLLHARGREK